jgi:hypothetical protein
MRWRSLPAVLLFAVLASPLVLEAQQSGKTYRRESAACQVLFMEMQFWIEQAEAEMRETR